MTDRRIDAAYEFCRRIAVEHYENFPIATRLMGRDKRDDLVAIYAFLRTADDIADNVDVDVNQRLRMLLELESKLHRCYRDDTVDPVFVALSRTVKRSEIPITLFLDLLNAFKVDLFKNRYRTFDELLEYCGWSANPVGAMVLHVWGYHRRPDFGALKNASDEICTGLQLTNHWQDIFVDRTKNRLYLPLEDLETYQYSQEEWERSMVTASFRSLMAFEVDRVRGFFDRGRTLLSLLRPMHRLHIAMVRMGGVRILDKLETANYDMLNNRPVLGLADGWHIGWNLLRRR